MRQRALSLEARKNGPSLKITLPFCQVKLSSHQPSSGLLVSTHVGDFLFVEDICSALPHSANSSFD